MGEASRKFEYFARRAAAEDRDTVLRHVVRETIAQTPVRTGFTRRQWKMRGARPGQANGTIAALSLGRRIQWVLPVAWAERLANGWSRQAPKGWIDRIIDRAIALVKR